MPLSPTSRAALVRIDPNPTTGDFVDPTVINGNMTTIDGLIGAVPCTAAARPSTPFTGELAYETDTRRTIVRAAGGWDPVSGTFSCTSGARPATPYEGMLIRETDTRRIYVWNATQGAWDLVNDPLLGVTMTSAWTAYTPTWTAATTNPVLGNGTVVGRSRTIGKTMDIWIKLTWGTTTTAVGAGGWRFTIPAAVQPDQLLSVYVDDSSASARWAGQCRLLGAATGDNMRIITSFNTGAIASNNNPMTWANLDIMILQGTVELA